MPFKLHSNYTPSGDQPTAIAQLTEGVLNGDPQQTLLGVTGSGKTEIYLKIAKNVIQNNKTVLILVPEIALTPSTSSEPKS